MAKTVSLYISNGNRTEWSPIPSVNYYKLQTKNLDERGVANPISFHEICLQTETDDMKSNNKFIIKYCIFRK